jgi:hypothetical protein
MLRLLSDKGGKMVTRAFIVYCQLSNYGAIPMRETSELMLSHCFNVQSALKPLEHLMIYEDFNDMELVRRAFDMCSRGNAPHACQIILKMMKRKNMTPTSEMYGFLVNAYSRSGQQAAALNAFREYVQVYDEKYKNGRHVLYSSAINACHQDYGGDSELKVGTAFEILRDYIEEVQKYENQFYIRPFNSMLGILTRADSKRFSVSKQVHEVMSLIEENDVLCNFATFEITIGSFGEASTSLFQEAEDFENHGPSNFLGTSSMGLGMKGESNDSSTVESDTPESRVGKASELRERASDFAREIIRIFRMMVDKSNVPPSRRLCEIAHEAAENIEDAEALEFVQETIEMIEELEADMEEED